MKVFHERTGNPKVDNLARRMNRKTTVYADMLTIKGVPGRKRKKAMTKAIRAEFGYAVGRLAVARGMARAEGEAAR